MANGEPHATLAQVKRIIRRKLRHQTAHEELGLNIYPMMDMMTILLVFLIMQFAATQANLVQSEDLRIPYSSSKQQQQSGLTLQVSRTNVVVDGEEVLRLRNGIVDPSLKQGGGNGFLITPMHVFLQRKRDLAKRIAQLDPQRPFLGDVQIIADRRTPYRTLIEIVYTLGQTEYKRLHFIVLREDQPRDQGRLGLGQHH